MDIIVARNDQVEWLKDRLEAIRHFLYRNQSNITDKRELLTKLSVAQEKLQRSVLTISELTVSLKQIN